MSEFRKLVLVHLLLNVYLLAIVQPMYPILDYMINYDYIVEQLCENREKPVMACNGKCYLGQKVAKNQTSYPDTDKPLPPAVDFDKLLTVREGPISYSFFDPQALQSKPVCNPMLLGTDHLNEIFRPPII